MPPRRSPAQDRSAVRLWRLLRGRVRVMFGVVVMLGLLAGTDMVVPWLLKLLVDDVFPTVAPGGDGSGWSLLWLILPGVALATVLRNALFYASRMKSTRLSEDVCVDLRRRLFEHLQRLGLRYYRANRPGHVSARLMDDTYRVQSFIQDKLPMLVRYAIELSVLLVIIHMVNWRLALAAAVVLPFHLWTWSRFRGPIRRSHSEAQARLADAHAGVVESFLGIEVVKGFGAEDRESASFHRAIDAGRDSAIRTQRYHFTQKVIADLLVGAGTVLLLGYGAWEVRAGRMTGGGFLMFFWYVKMLYPAVLEVISGAGHLTRAAASVDRVHELLDEPIRDTSGRAEGVAELGPLTGDLIYERVSFRYEDDGPPVLRDVSLRITPGEHVAITGPSGAGKSTLISMLPRFNEPDTGRVLVDGRPTSAIETGALRGLFGFVFQDLFLFHASVRENLRYARPGATDDEIVEACRATGADEVIRRLPEGYGTVIGGPGGELSRGEKQRLTIARALVRDPRVLVIDEATASIDPESAHAIIRSILQRMVGRTVIMVTHDLAMLELVDRVVVLEGGRIVRDEPSPRAAHPATIVEPNGLFDEIDIEASGDGTGAAPSPSAGPFADPASGAGPVLGPGPAADAGPPRPAPRLRPGGGSTTATSLLAAAVMLGGLAAVTPGCSSTTTTRDGIALDAARTNGGLPIEEDDPVALARLAAALDDLVLEPGAGPGDVPVPRGGDVLPVAFPDGPSDLPAAMDAAIGAIAAPPSDPDAIAVPMPTGSVELLELPRLSDVELADLVDRLVLEMQSVRGYGMAPRSLEAALPPAPRGVVVAATLARPSAERTQVLRLGSRSFLSQPPQLWLAGVSVGDDGDLESNADLALLPPLVEGSVAAMRATREDLAVQDLEKTLIKLSYVDTEAAMSMLQGMGMTTVEKPEDMPEDLTFEKLPVVLRIPDPKAEARGLVGADLQLGRGEFGVSLTPSVAGRLNDETIASPTTQLMVLWHPAHPGQLSRVRGLIDDYIDRPARQIFVEGMVLEISDEGLKDLGVEWQLQEGPINWRFGSPRADGQTDTLDLQSDDLDFWRVFTRDFEWKWSARIRTLIENKKAEVLSRPSVLTLDNRQSTIRVGEDIPVATSTEGTSGNSNRIAFTFKYLPTGILLNIRPRVNEDADEVSMLIDTIVSSVVPGADLVIRSQDGDELASAPTISTRRVQTYARIRNNTPFIIGGLVSRQTSTTIDKVPLLGDLPLIGGLFRAERSEREKREVIIVLTPFILPDDNYIPRSLPKDEDLFDAFGQQLYRDSYRIREEDVFDLGFLYGNPRLIEYKNRAKAMIRRDVRLAEREPFASFDDDRMPGESVLVSRMIYEVVKRLGVADRVDIDRTIFLESQRPGGYDVRFVGDAMSRIAGSERAMDFFTRYPDKAMVVQWVWDPDADIEDVAARPVPEVSIVSCPDRKTWSDLSWQLSQPLPDGRERAAIVLADPTDVQRLRRSIALKRIVKLNGGPGVLVRNNFSVGKVLLMPVFEEDTVHVLDREVARYFAWSEHYYGATIEGVKDAMRDLDRELAAPAPVSGLRSDVP